MALPQSGVQLVAEGERQFLAAMGRATGALDTFTARTERAASQSEGFAARFSSAWQGVSQHAAGDLLARGLEFAAQAFTSAATAGLQYNIALENTSAALNALTKDQKLTNNILAFAAEEAARTPFAFQEIASAIRGIGPAAIAAGQPVKDILQDIEILAASKPEEGIAGATFALREALSGDFTSIIERFDLPRQYINQLRAEGLPNIEVVRRAMQSLGMDLDLVTNLSQTLTGRWSTFLDTLREIAKRASEPTFEVLKQGLADLQGFFDRNRATINAWADLIGNQVANAARFAGQALAEGARQLSTVWNSALTNLEGGTARSLGRVAGIMAGLAKQAVSWGQNIVNSLSQGIMGAISLVVRALSHLGNIISGWLKPGSPPKLLPDLDEWGKGAADAWLEGWTQADFGALKDIGRIASDLIQQAGGRDNPASIPMTINTKGAVASALQQFKLTGSVGEDAYQRIREAAGGAGAQIAELTRRQVDLMTAQRKLNDVTRQYDEALKPLYDRLQSIQDAQTVADEEERLKEIAFLQKSIFTSDAERQKLAREAEEIRLRQQIRGIERQRDTATEAARDEVDAADAALAQYRERLTIQQETNELEQEQSELLKRLRDAQLAMNDAVSGLAEKLEEALSPLLAAIEANQLQQEEMRDTIRLAEIEHELGKDNLTVAQRRTLELEKQGILLRRQQRGERAAELGIDLSSIINTPVVLADIEKVRKAAGGIGDAIAGAASAGAFNLDALREEFATTEEEILNSFTGLENVGADFGLGFKEGLASVQDEWGTFNEKITELVAPFAGIAAALGTFGILTTIAGWVAIAAVEFGKLSVAITGAGGFLSWIVGVLGGPVTIAIGLVAAAVGLLTYAWITDWGNIQEKTRDAWFNYIWPTLEALRGFITDTVIPTAQRMLLWLGQKFTEASETLQEAWETIIHPVLQELWDFTTEYIIPLLTETYETMVMVRDIGARAIQGAWDNILYPIFQLLVKWLKEYIIGEVRNTIIVFQDLAAYLSEKLGPIIGDFIEGTLERVEEAFSAIKRAISTVISKLQDLQSWLENVSLPSWLTPGSPTPLENGLWGIASATQAVNSELGAMGGILGSLANATVSPTINPVSSGYVAPPASGAQMMAAGMGGYGGGPVTNYTLNQTVPASVAKNTPANFNLMRVLR